MSKAVPSDGRVNKLFLKMVARGLKSYNRKEIDEVANDDNLKQCKYETLIAFQNAYILAFNDKCWPAHAHIIIKAEQSSTWRAYRDKQQGIVGGTVSDDDGDDPLAELRS